MPGALHYIWAGPYREEVGLEEIGSHAVQLCAMDIYLWCLAPYKAEIACKVNANSNLKIVGLLPTPGTLEPEAVQYLQALLGTDTKLIQAAVEHFIHNRAFSAIKDLWMLVILYGMGGIYIDTTVQPASAELLASLRGKPARRGTRYQLGLFDPAPSSKVPYFPRIGTTTMFSRPPPKLRVGGLDQLYNAIIADGHREEPGAMTPDVDVWACYATLPRNEYLGIMLKDYLAACLDSKFVNANDSILADRVQRRGPVGDMIINAVQVGLLAAQKAQARSQRSGVSNAEAKEFGERFTWEAVVLPKEEKGAFYVPQLGIVKHHAGSWYDKK